MPPRPVPYASSHSPARAMHARATWHPLAPFNGGDLDSGIALDDTALALYVYSVSAVLRSHRSVTPGRGVTRRTEVRAHGLQPWSTAARGDGRSVPGRVSPAARLDHRGPGLGRGDPGPLACG